MSHRRARSIRAVCGAVAGALIATALLVPAPAQAAPPSNDNFSSATNLGSAVPAVGSGSNIEATTEAGEPVQRSVVSATGTIWWRWTAPATGRYRVDICDTLPALNSTLGVFTGSSVSALANAASVGTGRTTAVEPYTGGECATGSLQAAAFDAVAGTVFSFAAGGQGGATSSNIVLRVSRPAVNDNFASATDLGSAVPAIGVGSNEGASTEVNEPVQRSVVSATGTIWWRWTAPATGRFRVDICDTLPAHKSTLAVFTGSNVGTLANATSVGTGRTAATRDYPGGECATGSLQAAAFDAVAGTVYSIAIGGQGGSTSSNIVLKLSRPAPNDNFASATDLGSAVPAVGVGSNEGGSTEVNEPVQRSVFSATGTIWWRWTAPATGRYRVDMCDTLPALQDAGCLHRQQRLDTGKRHDSRHRRTPATQPYPGGECANGSLQAAAFDAVAGTVYTFAAGGSGGATSPQIRVKISLPGGGGAIPPPTTPTTPTTPTSPSQACVVATDAVTAAAAAKDTANKRAVTAKKRAKAAAKQAKAHPSAKNKAAAAKVKTKAKKAKAKAKAATKKYREAKAAQASAC